MRRSERGANLRDYGVCATLLVGVQTKRLDKGAVWEGRGGHSYSVSSALYRSVRPKKRPSYVDDVCSRGLSSVDSYVRS